MRFLIMRFSSQTGQVSLATVLKVLLIFMEMHEYTTSCQSILWLYHECQTSI